MSDKENPVCPTCGFFMQRHDCEPGRCMREEVRARRREILAASSEPAPQSPTQNDAAPSPLKP